MFFCEKCNKHVIKVFPRVKIRVIDLSDSTIFVLFDKDATTLLNKGCTNMLEGLDKDLLKKFTNESTDYGPPAVEVPKDNPSTDDSKIH
ncbi:Nucleic acid-binding [Vigna unguiculata]|uniref:Nucleic acid-binding n=1 Tax=Vigna unguiculata TaxID=3917 RepID=A0A4D6KQU1_VIGUN|nr:Nucleic acid-binding [Vigna unguiculata]